MGSLNKFVLMFMIFVTFTDGNHGDYHPSSSAFDEGKLSSISRFYPIEIRKCQFEILSEYPNIRQDNDECKHQCLTQCHINSGCNAARCDEELGHCVIGFYDETMGCSSDTKNIDFYPNHSSHQFPL